MNILKPTELTERMIQVAENMRASDNIMMLGDYGISERKTGTIVACYVNVQGQQGKSVLANNLVPLDASFVKIEIESNNRDGISIENDFDGGSAGEIAKQIAVTKAISKPNILAVDLGNADALSFINESLDNDALRNSFDVFVIPVISSGGMASVLQTAGLLVGQGVNPSLIRVLPNKIGVDTKPSNRGGYDLSEFEDMKSFLKKDWGVSMDLNAFVPNYEDAFHKPMVSDRQLSMIQIIRGNTVMPENIFDEDNDGYYLNLYLDLLMNNDGSAEAFDEVDELSTLSEWAAYCETAYKNLEAARRYVYQ